jgi:N-acylneuraminate cytidylyltransferase
MMESYDSVFSAYKEHWIPRWSIDGKPHQWDMNNRPMRQDKEELFVENGAFYITTKERLLSSGLRYSGSIGIYEMPMERSFQIDTLEDLGLIKKLMS